ncbi:hypothetical protein [Vibrio parahaemolyticus]|uniref:hypothetical protein n=1 Tax=Vibrio parahaemolyticus TaxID=670 RepID=UPI00226B7D15|nr:hypothetical protein [Vibrio parahaemolyticus]MCX8941250.1 hypothetical protein [Vibrio parahaemolyticus]
MSELTRIKETIFELIDSQSSELAKDLVSDIFSVIESKDETIEEYEKTLRALTLENSEKGKTIELLTESVEKLRVTIDVQDVSIAALRG